MTLDSGWVGALASLVSALIVAVTAIAAFRQLKHYRNANDIVVYLRLIDQMDSPLLIQARGTLSKITAIIEAKPEYLERLRDPTFIPDEFLPIATLLRFLEHISVLIGKGGIAESLVLSEYADIFVSIWDQLRPVILERRVALGEYTGRAFEHLAMRSRRYIESGAMQREYDLLERDTRPLPNRASQYV